MTDKNQNLDQSLRREQPRPLLEVESEEHTRGLLHPASPEGLPGGAASARDSGGSCTWELGAHAFTAGLLSALLLAQVLFVNISHQLIRKIVSKCLFPLALCVLFCF